MWQSTSGAILTHPSPSSVEIGVGGGSSSIYTMDWSALLYASVAYMYTSVACGQCYRWASVYASIALVVRLCCVWCTLLLRVAERFVSRASAYASVACRCTVLLRLPYAD